ncbi:MAG: DUF3857 domain-containing protein [Sphingobacteriaceae bacterium]|nr:MAG: DUF3857 domain-containing protein [Sphingobacteriaceae bacterium]
MKYWIAACFITISITLQAQSKYDVSIIPKELLPYASTVVRNSETKINVKNAGNTVYYIKQAITVLNANGDDEAEIELLYDKIRTVKYVKGIIYNAAGLPIAKFSEKNFDDRYAGNYFSLFEDTRMKLYRPAISSYPYTIEYEYEIRSKETLLFDSWRPAGTIGSAVQKSSFTFSCFSDFTIQYKEYNLPVKAVTATNADGLKTYTWEVSKLKATKFEPYSPDPDKFLPTVKIAPVTFKYEEISGAFNNWKELGKWYYDKLLTGRDALPGETVMHIKAITAGITNPKEKAKKIYEYMQYKTRYISVQIGIGGYQPFPASYVDKFSYGDCKALSNYTMALMNVVGIESYFCLVNAGQSKVNADPGFSSMNQFDHAILCLPFKNDTTFLECTDQKSPFGFLGSFTDDRIVLACTPQGGKLLHTPKYSADSNLQQRKAELNIKEDGMLTGDMKTVYKGTQYDNREDIIGEPQAEKIKGYKKLYPINNMEIIKLELTQDKSLQPVTTETISFEADDYASVKDGKFYFMPNIANRRGNVLREVRNRQNEVYINRGYTDDDKITYTIPAGYKTDKELLDVSLNKPFGKFTATVTVKNNQLTYKRYMQIVDGIYNKTTYPELVEFFQSVFDADHYTVMLKKGD